MKTVAAALMVGILAAPAVALRSTAQPALGARSSPVIREGRLSFRDLNRNGKLDRYEDWRLADDLRAADLVARMTLAEKAGAMLHAVARGARSAGGESRAGYDLEDARRVIDSKHVNNLLTRIAVMPRVLAEHNNALQEIAEHTRLGIPLTISTDPRNHFNYVSGASSRNMGFSQWPETLGFGALGDAKLVHRFADIARQEYRATGITMALSPQIDVASEPRWGRFSGTFGADPDMIARLGAAYIKGFQGRAGGLAPNGVLAVAKHWTGYGTAADGWDSHNYYGRFSAIRADSLPLHARPFAAAVAANVGGIMPTYSIPRDLEIDGKPVEQVGVAFNKAMIDGMLRKRLGFRGLVVSDWRITDNCEQQCRDGAPAGEKPDGRMFGMPWGVEQLTVPQRFAKAIAAGVDSFGGVDTTEALVAAVEQGLVPMARIDEAVRRILMPKFRQGLFENPYVDVDTAATFVGNPALLAEGRAAQARATVLLKNTGALLPLRPTIRRLWTLGVSDAAVRAAGFEPVDRPELADVAVIRTATPYQLLHPGFLYGALHHEGDLDFAPDHPARLAIAQARAAGKPVVLVVMLDRPAILTALEPDTQAILANFGLSDQAMFEVLAGRARPAGRMPFALPRSMAAVRAQRSDLPNDDASPLYPFGAGLTMPARR